MTRKELVNSLRLIPANDIETALRDRLDVVFLMCWSADDISKIIDANFEDLCSEEQIDNLKKLYTGPSQYRAGLVEELEINDQSVAIIAEHVKATAAELGYIKEN